MSLRKATLLAIIGLCYTFALKGAGTIFPEVFRNITVARAVEATSFLASLTVVLFFVSFYINYVRPDRILLKRSTLAATIGVMAVSLLQLIRLSVVFFERYLSPGLVWALQAPHLVKLLVPWAAFVLVLFFFLIFHKETQGENKGRLKIATFWGIIGSSSGALVRTFVLFNFLYSEQVGWFFNPFARMLVVLIPFVVISFVASLFFLLSFYREQRELVPQRE
jgi:hypothetical protein